MASVVQNGDGTLTGTLSAEEQKVMVRWASDRGVTVASQLGDFLTEVFITKRDAYRAVDGPKLFDKYAALSTKDQAKIDALLQQ